VVLRMIVGLGLTVIAFAVAGHRLWWLRRVALSGQPAPERLAYARDNAAVDARALLTEVIGQRKLLKWSVPGAAHAATFWGFLVLLLTIVEAYGALFSRTFAIPVIGHWAVIGFAEDLFAVGVLAGITVFTVIRLRASPRREGRRSRFFGSHTGAAWLVLWLIGAVIVTLLLYRGAQQDTGVFPYPDAWAFASWTVARVLRPLGYGVNSVLEATFILAQLAVVLGFLVLVVYSKHLHIFLAPLNVLFSRRPDALGPLEPMRSEGKVLDFEEADPDTDTFGIGKVEDLTWKGLLDLGTCTECGRCQSRCPAWATGKPLSPKQLIMDLRDHALDKAPYLLASEEERVSLAPDILELARRPLVGPAEDNGVIDPEVIWSCTNCGACVEECPVDIEHIDHINGMRRHQVLVESAFPQEATAMLNNLERRGNPWGMAEDKRLEWVTELGFDVPVLDGKIPDDTDYLFWVGCAGALEDRAKKTTRAVAELLHDAGVKFAVLGPAETCTGDPARRLGNEFAYQMLARQNVETLNQAGVAKGTGKKVIASCAHCFNTIGREYPQLGGNYEVIHHTELLAKLVAEGRITPVTQAEGGQKVTYHDPCFLGRHNKVFAPPRDLIGALPATQAQEMERSGNRSFCCGAGGARMWLEENTGTRINDNRATEALATGADVIATACPFCNVMLGDAVNARKASGQARDNVEVIDVAQLLVRAVKLRDQQAGGTS
jgi:Fe-S oxidoreductase